MINQKILISIVFIVILATMGFSVYKSQNNKSSSSLDQARITNFEECAEAGYPVMEIYPRQCRTISGELFVENVVIPNPDPAPISGTTTGYARGHVTIGPICPVERVDQPCEPSPETYTSREVLVYASDSITIKKRVHLDAQGNYNILLSPGSYYLQISPAGIGPGEKKPATIKLNQTTVVDFDIDTGIR